MIFSVLAFVALMISICVKKRKRSLIFQMINCAFESIYAFSISAYTGAVLGIVNVCRSSVFLNKSKFSKQIYLCILFVFELIIIVNCYLTWGGYISLYPTIGSLIRTYCLWQSDMKLVRCSGMISGFLFSMYYGYNDSMFMVLGYVVLIIVSALSIIKYDILDEYKLRVK